MRLLAFGSLLLFLCSCRNDLPPGAVRINLDQELGSVGASVRQVYWTVTDTSSWRETLAAADTTYVEGSYHKFRSNRIWYEYVQDDGIIKSEYHYPGFERKIDSIKPDRTIVYSGRWERLLVDAPVADIALGGDSVRVGVLHGVEKAFPWQRFDLDTADYLILLPSGQDSLPISLNQDNIGPVTGQTVFRIGRKYYGLRSLSDDHREMIVEPLPTGRDLPVTASLDLAHRKISVNTLDGEAHQLKSRPGKELLLFFTNTHPWGQESSRRLDSAYQALPAGVRDDLDVAVVYKHTTPVEIRSVLDTLGLQLPVYLENDKTCLRLNCRPYLPYFVEVDRRGQYRTFWGNLQQLDTKFSALSNQESDEN